MTGGTTLLFVAAGAGALLAVGAGLEMIVGVAPRQALKARLETTVQPYTRAGSRPAAEPGLGQSLRRMPVMGRLAGLLALRWDPPDLYPVAWWILLLAAGLPAVPLTFAATKVVGTAVWFALPLLWLAIARSIFSSFHARRSRMLYKQLPDALSMIVRSVRSGIPVTEALRGVGRDAAAPTAGEFARLYDELSIGVPLNECLWQMARRTGVPEYRFFAVALSLQGQTGGNLTDTLENLGDVIRKRVALRLRAVALAGEARSTAMILAAIPFVTAGLLALISPDYIIILFTTQGGQHMLALGVLLLTLGMGSMRYMIRKSLR